MDHRETRERERERERERRNEQKRVNKATCGHPVSTSSKKVEMEAMGGKGRQGKTPSGPKEGPSQVPTSSHGGNTKPAALPLRRKHSTQTNYERQTTVSMFPQGNLLAVAEDPRLRHRSALQTPRHQVSGPIIPPTVIYNQPPHFTDDRKRSHCAFRLPVDSQFRFHLISNRRG